MNLLAERVKWLLAQQARTRPGRVALLWDSVHVPRGSVHVIDRRQHTAMPAAMAVSDIADAPPDVLLVVIHPAMRVDMRRAYLREFPCTLDEADRQLAEALVDIAVAEQPDLRAAWGW